jgi:anaerobic dimethyl sulfoxide reductase subunit A
MTPTVQFADIVLPTNTFFERNDMVLGVGLPFYGSVNKAIESRGESKSHLEIANLLAVRLGLSNYEVREEETWLEEMVNKGDIPSYSSFKRKGVYRLNSPEPYVAFKKEIDNPSCNPFPTPSGKIEIFSKQLEDLNYPGLPAIPKYIETWESRNDSLANKYPLQLITTHMRRRANNQFENVPWLSELEHHRVLINSSDALARDIDDGDMVRVFNDRGELLIQAAVTERIMPGVVDIPQGAWYKPDEKGIDIGGCANVLTRDTQSPGGAFTYNTCLVQIEKL